jgi:citronellol/citronellal dehydrogenase
MGDQGRLAGRRAVITGASRGIGAATAQRFAAEGAAVALVARTLDRHDHLPGSLLATQEKCRSYGGQVEVIRADLTDGADRERIVADASGALGGPVDVLVNNAAAAIYHPMLDFSLKRRRLTFEVNVHAPFDLLQAALPGMRELGAGWVVNVSSATAGYPSRAIGEPTERGRQDSPMGVYGASKAALERLSYAFAQELAGDGIRLNVVAPNSAVRTEGAAALMGDSLDPALIEPVESMVEAILFLACAPSELTGGNYRSRDLLAAHAVTVMGLDGKRRSDGTPA